MCGTCQRLPYRHLGTDKSCPRCGAQEEMINHMIFECPTTLQVWALSDFLSLLDYFPSTSLFQNMDILFWRTEERGLPKPQRDIYSWIIWYIWKDRNTKLFNGKETSPLDTLQLTRLEEDSWRFAQVEEDDTEEGESYPQTTITATSGDPLLPVCQVNASWVGHGPTSGLGWGCTDTSGKVHTGRRGCRRSSSALYAELEGLTWAMECLKQNGFSSIRFETDCSYLLKMIDDPLDWPTFQTELDYLYELRDSFANFYLTLIPRSCNAHADALAKDTRLYLFPCRSR